MHDVGSITHPGKIRRRNEDAYLVRSDTGMWAVADGMGGHDAGDLASRIVIEALDAVDHPYAAADLLDQCKVQMARANADIAALSQQRAGETIGTTVAILLIRDGHYACVWAGDSRIYRATAESIDQLSSDHTEIEELIARGAVSKDEAKSWPNNIITRAIGVAADVELEAVTGPVEPGDVFVVCSDGLTKHVQDDEIHRVVAGQGAQPACDALLALALERGGHDNITAIVVRTNGASLKEKTITAPQRPTPGAAT